MGQLGFFDADKRLQALSARGDPLEAIDHRSATERARRSDRANDWHRAGARQDRLAESGLQHPPPGDAGTARRGVKTVESSAVFQPKQWAEKEARKTIENRT